MQERPETSGLASSYPAARTGFPDARPAVFISFEGIDGSGKSTQAHLLTEQLRAVGRWVVLVRDPGGTPLGEQIRSLLLHSENEIAARAELLLFAAARAQLVDVVIRPALSDGAIVIADRFFDSTTAYQGGGREVLEAEDADAFHSFVTGGLIPDLTVVVDLDVATAQRRRVTQPEDRMESEGLAFQERVRSTYLALIEGQPHRLFRLDGQLAPDLLAKQIYRLVSERLAS